MPIQQIPMMKGTKRSQVSADYLDALPVNMLAVPKEVLNSNGYFRSFPGIDKRSDVSGASRGAMYNSNQNAVYRLCGDTLYRGTEKVGTVSGSERVSMAQSYSSHAVGANGAITLFRYDDTVKTMSNWDDTSGFTQYELGSVRDMCRNRSRYVWCKDGSDSFFISDLEDESKPDRYSAEYRAEAQPDGIIGIDNWRDFVVCFGSKTIEYFSLTGNASSVGVALYISQPSMMVQRGIAGTWCKAKYADSHAILSHPASGSPSVYLINSGSSQQIATSTIEAILQEYTADELSQSIMESVRFLSHELLIIHMLRHVLVYDGTVQQSGPQWSVLKTGIGNDIYRAIDFIFEGSAISCGDKASPLTGILNFNTSHQYGEDQEHLLFTPLIKADSARAFDFEVEAAGGASQIARRLFISTTTDGINFGREVMINQDAPFRYDSRTLLRRVGRVRKNIGFRLRIITDAPVTISGCQVRIE